MECNLYSRSSKEGVDVDLCETVDPNLKSHSGARVIDFYRESRSRPQIEEDVDVDGGGEQGDRMRDIGDDPTDRGAQLNERAVSIWQGRIEKK